MGKVWRGFFKKKKKKLLFGFKETKASFSATSMIKKAETRKKTQRLCYVRI